MRYNLPLFILIILLGILASSCKKDKLDPSQIGDTAFTSNFNFNDTDYEMTAGLNDLLLQTQTANSNDTIIFESSLAPISCQNCGPGLYLNLTSEELASEWTTGTLTEKLPTWTYSYTPDSSHTETMQVIASSGFGSGFWFINDVLQSNNASESFAFELESYGAYQLGFEAESGICGDPATQNIAFNDQPVCYGNIIQNQQDPSMFFATISEGFNFLTTSYTWTHGDSVYTNSGPTFELSPQVQAQTLCLDISDPGACSYSVCYNLPPTPIQCSNNFTIDSTFVITESNPIPSTVLELQFIDNEGNVYSSHAANQDQPSNSSIELLSAEPYTEPSEPTRNLTKVTFSLNCTLFNSSGTGFNFIGIVESAFEDPGL